MKYFYLDINKLEECDFIKDTNIVLFLDILNDYVNTNYILNKLLDLEEYKFKNIINYINHRWIKINNTLLLQKNKSTEKKNIKLTSNVSFLEFNEILLKFIDNNLATAIFVINCLMMYL